MYEVVEFFDEENGLTLDEVLKSCIVSYYEKRYVYVDK